MLKAIERGFVQQEIQNAAYEYQQRVDNQEAIVVGVNRFEVEEEKPIPIQRIDPDLERKQVERVRALRAKRDAGPWRAALAWKRPRAQGQMSCRESSPPWKRTRPLARSPMRCERSLENIEKP